jgi:glutathione S-transferase
MATTADRRPVLWHLQLSHFNEKVRWALDLKRIDHVRRPLLPGVHLLVCRRLTDGACETTPVLQLDGRAFGESSQIIAELERCWPDPPLYPADLEQRARALELEALCDEELGVHVRRAAYASLLERPDLLVPSFTHDQPPIARALVHATFPLLRFGIKQRFRVTEEKAAASRERVLAAAARLEEELGDREYLVGDHFSVADLSAASLMYPAASPATFPYPIPAIPPDAQEFIGGLAQRPLGRYVTRMYERHRAVPGVRRTLR